MLKMLEELYHGTSAPAASVEYLDPFTLESRKDAENAYRRLYVRLEEREQKMLDELIDSYDTVECMQQMECFFTYFRMGAQMHAAMMMEINPLEKEANNEKGEKA